MNLLRAYLVEGYTLEELARTLDFSTADLRSKFRSVGFLFPRGSFVDTVSAAIHQRGYKTFDAFAREHSLCPFSEDRKSVV